MSKKHIDDNGIEWSIFGDYQMAIIDRKVVVIPVEGADATQAIQNFRDDMTALAQAGMVTIHPEEVEQ